MRRWRVSITTVRRREQQGILRSIWTGTHVVRYRLSDVVRTKDEAAAGRECQEREEYDEKSHKLAVAPRPVASAGYA
jgi:hypothetical protein